MLEDEGPREGVQVKIYVPKMRQLRTPTVFTSGKIRFIHYARD
jgi:hypothetical protein